MPSRTQNTDNADQERVIDLFHMLRGFAQVLGRFVEELRVSPQVIAFGKAFVQFAANLNEWHEWIERAPEELRAALKDEAVLPHPRLSLPDLASVIAEFHKDGSAAAVRRLYALHDELFGDEAFRLSLQSRWQASDRWVILEQVLRAHDLGLDGVSIPAALAQAEGIIAGAAGHSGKFYLRNFRDCLSKWRKTPSIDGPVLDHFQDSLFHKFEHGDALPRFSRHAILHGADVAYGTKDKSLTALVWLDYLLMLVISSQEA
jgi:hypothetical protein